MTLLSASRRPTTAVAAAIGTAMALAALPVPALAQALEAASPDGVAVDTAASYSLTTLWAQGDPVARATLLILAAMSVASWFVLLVKLVEQHRLMRQASKAGRVFRNAASLDEGLATLAENSPMRALAAAAIEANRHHQGDLAEAVDRHTWIGLCLTRSITPIVGGLQGGMAVLATVAATAPFVGLFGTVWGIHHALTVIGLTGQASIDKVAGPVGESLTMTAIGLVVAVPAVIGHNALARRNRRAADMVRAFGGDLHAALLSGRRMGEPDGATRRRPQLLARMA